MMLRMSAGAGASVGSSGAVCCGCGGGGGCYAVARGGDVRQLDVELDVVLLELIHASLQLDHHHLIVVVVVVVVLLHLLLLLLRLLLHLLHLGGHRASLP